MEAIVRFTRHIWWKHQPAPDLSAGDVYHAFNLAEGCVWLILAGLVLRRAWHHQNTAQEWWYAAAFALFGLSDFVEAFALTTWLIAVKAGLLIALLVLRHRVLRQHYPDSQTY